MKINAAISGLLCLAVALFFVTVSVTRSVASPEVCQVERLVKNPAEDSDADEFVLSVEEANSAWSCLARTVSEKYSKTANFEFLDWKKFSSSPYQSAHNLATLEDGEEQLVYVLNFANEEGADYGLYDVTVRFKVGTVLVKPSFVVGLDGSLNVGGIALMERMPDGYNPEHFNWRYQLYWPKNPPDGLKLAKGAGTQENCASCHLVYGEKPSVVLFPPEENRLAGGLN